MDERGGREQNEDEQAWGGEVRGKPREHRGEADAAIVVIPCFSAALPRSYLFLGTGGREGESEDER